MGLERKVGSAFFTKHPSKYQHPLNQTLLHHQPLIPTSLIPCTEGALNPFLNQVNKRGKRHGARGKKQKIVFLLYLHHPLLRLKPETSWLKQSPSSKYYPSPLASRLSPHPQSLQNRQGARGTGQAARGTGQAARAILFS